MKELFEKIKERLETELHLADAEKEICARENQLQFDSAKGYANGIAVAIEIVNQIAEETNKGEISDGYHTFNELYHHRAILFSVICNSNKELAWKSRLHDTGDMYDGMFIVGIETPEGQATYHYDIEPYWDMFEVKKLQNAPKWDGHTPDEAIRRIGLLGKDINTSSNDGCIPLSKVAFDRMIARMESESERDIYEEESLFINVRDAARIVHEIAKEYSNSEIPNMSEKVTGSDVPDINVGKNEVEHMLDTIEMRADETWMDYYRKALKGLRELSGKEYNDGWIPCSERLPENKDLCWLTNVWSDGTRHVTYDFYIKGGGWYDTVSDSVLAWMPINKPAPYKPKGEM